MFLKNSDKLKNEEPRSRKLCFTTGQTTLLRKVVDGKFQRGVFSSEKFETLVRADAVCFVELLSRRASSRVGRTKERKTFTPHLRQGARANVAVGLHLADASMNITLDRRVEPEVLRARPPRSDERHPSGVLNPELLRINPSALDEYVLQLCPRRGLFGCLLRSSGGDETGADEVDVVLSTPPETIRNL